MSAAAGVDWSAAQEIPCSGSESASSYCFVEGAVLGADKEMVTSLSIERRRSLEVAVSVRRAGETTWSAPKVLNTDLPVQPNWDPTIRSSRTGAIADHLRDRRARGVGAHRC